jgi:hypothetical protein
MAAREKRTINFTLLFLVALSAVFLYPGCSSAQPKADVPDLISRRFNAIYPNAQEASWETVTGGYEVTFFQNKTEVIVLFLEDGGVERTKVKSDTPSLPKAAADYIVQNLEGKEITSVYRIIDGFGTVTWEVRAGDMGYLFATNGGLMGQLPPKAKTNQ